MESSAQPIRDYGREDSSPYTSAEIALSTDSLGVYLSQIGRRPLLKAEQEVELAQRIEAGVFAGKLLAAWPEADEKPQGDDYTVSFDPKLSSEATEADTGKETKPATKTLEDVLDEYVKKADGDPQLKRDLLTIRRDGEQARNLFIESNLRLVVSIAKQPKYQGRGLDLGALIQEGNIGLIEAVDKFDYMRGVKFSVVATSWIRQKIGVALESRGVRPVGISRQDAERVDALGRVKARFLAEKKEPTVSALAEAMKLSEKVIVELEEMSNPLLYLDHPITEEGDFTLGDTVAAKNELETPFTPEESKEKELMCELLVESLIRKGSDRYTDSRQVCIDYFGLFGRPKLSVAELTEKYDSNSNTINGILRRIEKRMAETGLFDTEELPHSNPEDSTDSRLSVDADKDVA